MQVDAGTIVIIIGVLAVLALALASGRRRSADRAGADVPRSRWLGTAAWLGIFGATAASSHPDGENRGGDEHGMGGDWSGGHGGGDYGGGGGWGGGDSGGGDGGGGGGD
jgi:hypothetical protein